MHVLKSATHGTASIATAGSSEILAANPRRRVAHICNSSTVGIWVAYGTAAVIGTGDYIPPNGGVLIIDELSGMWRGTVNGRAASGSGNVIGTVEFV